jgi:hypothetical protein
MDRSKLAIILSVATLIMVAALIAITLEKVALLKEIGVELNRTDFECCNVYRNPTLGMACYGNGYLTIPNRSTSYLPSP